MALSITYVRPDRVTKTGVIAPYPIRQNDPVALARNVLGPFIRGIRGSGPVYQNPQPGTMAGAMLQGGGHPQYVMMPGMPSGFAAQVIHRAKSATKGRPGVQHMGNRAIAMRNRRPHVAAAIGPQTVRRASGGLPRYQYDAARADYRWEQAAARGSVWDMIFSKQREMRLLRRPGWRKGYR